MREDLRVTIPILALLEDSILEKVIDKFFANLVHQSVLVVVARAAFGSRQMNCNVEVYPGHKFLWRLVWEAYIVVRLFVILPTFRFCFTFSHSYLYVIDTLRSF